MYGRRLFLPALVAAAVLSTGCGSSSNQEQTQKQLVETQKQLEQTKQQLQDAQAKAAQSTEQQATQGVKPAGAPVSPAAAPVAPAPRRPEEVKSTAVPPSRSATIPAGTTIVVRTTGLISTKKATEGSAFEATLVEPLVVDGYTVAKKGANVEGVVTNADPGGRVKGVATLAVQLRSIVADDGKRLAVRTSTVAREAKSSVKKDALKVGIGSGIGAAIGAIAGGGKGAAIGAGAGAAGGTGVVLATHGEPAEIPSESVLRFRLSAPVATNR